VSIHVGIGVPTEIFNRKWYCYCKKSSFKWITTKIFSVASEAATKPFWLQLANENDII
jgi:hypothetical protein